MPKLADTSILQDMHVDHLLAVVERNIPPEIILQFIKAIISTRAQKYNLLRKLDMYKQSNLPSNL
jgi:hypothetical protein